MDFDGISDENDRYPADPTQWADSDDDGYGDNPLGTNGDSCPSSFGNSTLGLLGSDQDGDGHADLTDDLPLEPTQWDDLDGDGGQHWVLTTMNSSLTRRNNLTATVMDTATTLEAVMLP